MERHSHGLEFELGLGGSSRPRELRAAPWDVLYKMEYLPHGPPLMIPQRRSRGRGSKDLPGSTSGPPRPEEAHVPEGQPPGTIHKPRGPQGPFPKPPSLYETFLFTLLTLNGFSCVNSLLNCSSQFPLK